MSYYELNSSSSKAKPENGILWNICWYEYYINWMCDKLIKTAKFSTITPDHIYEWKPQIVL